MIFFIFGISLSIKDLFLSPSFIELYQFSNKYILFNILSTQISFITISLHKFINPEPWTEEEGKAWIGIFLIIQKLIYLIPLIVIIIYYKNLGKSSGYIDPNQIIPKQDSLLADEESDENTLG